MSGRPGSDASHRPGVWLRRALGLLAAAWMTAAAGAEPAPLRIVAPTNQTMPFLRMEQEQPAEGMVKELGELLARRLGRTPQFVALPSKRAQMALTRGDADLHCYVKPGWLQGDLLFTQPFLPGAEVIAAAGDTPTPAHLRDLRDESLGTVLGYVYPDLETEFGQPVRRNDALDAEANLRRLAVGRMRYAITDRDTLRYWSARHPAARLRELFEIERYDLGCALPPREARLLEPINQAIAQMLADGSLDARINALMKAAPHGGPLRFIAPSSNAMPIAAFQQDVLVDGIVKDLGELLAQRLGRRAVFEALPSKRVRESFAAGRADAMCFVLPQWMPGDYHWTRGLIPDASLVVALAGTPPLKSLQDLADQPVGTVLGYRYPKVEAALGARLRRADVPTMEANLNRLLAGRIRYALLERTALQYHLARQPAQPAVQVVLEVERFEAGCAFSKQADVNFNEVQQQVDRLLSDGSIEKILARYR